uniref:Transmembrane protein n=1 Tax=Chromera velia CCMP2878 TaxID=1169474 RepID=A0A0G4IBI2_9ALVE|mmetsp:Transcript_49613/g.97772  ORF Transcript_49613/g.97772 Transcript_49613/m.97772 type:complete len:239 (-) Transcript_49613:132-848(-)|eukprot:Cvel_12770.t1-p1 / transcript=Cvel_12770.t1 / gene=Cvel_12770 / organism=Chromera_velia_CCMP2878 / gene_product=hypothetical protein / transcript_product=hypothetical protein / location=Cvel_scaffold849:58909-59622(+) / protein_length=238 / sequence_SO=supercontig / SO=protein_coding / is_pseudo=false
MTGRKVYGYETVETTDEELPEGRVVHHGRDGGDGQEEELSDLRAAAEMRRWETTMERLEWVWMQIQAVGWVAASIAVLYYTNLFRVIWECPNVHGPVFWIALLSGLCVALACLYAGIVVPLFGLPNVFDKQSPHFHPTYQALLAVMGLSSYLGFLWSLWPVWGWKTPFLQVTLLLGFVNHARLIPLGDKYMLASLCTCAVVLAAVMTAHFIPHEGLWHDSAACSLQEEQGIGGRDFGS